MCELTMLLGIFTFFVSVKCDAVKFNPTIHCEIISF